MPKKTILTNLHTDLDYNKLKSKLPKNIIPAFDGMEINIQLLEFKAFSIELMNFLEFGLVKDENVSKTFPFLSIIIL